MFVVCSSKAEELPRIIESKTVLLPHALEELLVHEYSDYYVPAERDYQYFKTPQNESHYEHLRENVDFHREREYHADWRKGLSYVCWGDFNGDSLTDVALLLLRCGSMLSEIGDKENDELFVVFHQTENGYEPYEFERGSKQLHFGRYLESQAPGKVLTVKGKGYAVAPDDPMPESIELTHEAIIYGWEGKAASLVYWEDGKYKQFWISD